MPLAARPPKVPWASITASPSAAGTTWATKRVFASSGAPAENVLEDALREAREVGRIHPVILARLRIPGPDDRMVENAAVSDPGIRVRLIAAFNPRDVGVKTQAPHDGGRRDGEILAVAELV